MELVEVQVDGCVDRVELESVAAAVRRLKSWVEGREVTVAGLMSAVSSFPEKSLADAGRASLRQAEQVLGRAGTAEQVPGFGAALQAGRVSGEHVDVLTRALRQLAPDARDELTADADPVGPSR